MQDMVLTFVRTSPFRPDNQYSRSILVPLRRPTADTAALVVGALIGLRTIYKPGYKMAKAGVVLVDLSDAAVEQQELDLEPDGCEDRSRAMAPVIGSLQFGQVVYVIEKERDFTLVEWRSEDGKVVLQGWVFSRYLKRFE